MGKIFYSLADGGLGHAVRAATLIDELRSRHSLVVFCAGLAWDFLSARFADTDVAIRSLPGSHRQASDVGAATRAVNRAVGFASRATHIAGFQRVIDAEQPDLAITGLEPLLPRAATRSGLRFVSVDYHHMFVAAEMSGLPPRLRRYSNTLASAARSITRGRQARTIVSSFCFPELGQRGQDVHHVGVFLRKALRRPHAADDRGHLCVYLRRADPRVLDALRLCGRRVRIYGLGPASPSGNVTFHEIDEAAFLTDLMTCEAVISSGGSQLTGEVLRLGKPLLALPERRHCEQELNAHLVARTGGGAWEYADEVIPADIKRFLDRLDDYRLPPADRSRLDGTWAALRVIEALLRPIHERPLALRA